MAAATFTRTARTINYTKTYVEERREEWGIIPELYCPLCGVRGRLANSTGSEIFVTLCCDNIISLEPINPSRNAYKEERIAAIRAAFNS